MRITTDFSRMFSYDYRDFFEDVFNIGYNSMLPFLFGYEFARTGNAFLFFWFILIAWFRIELTLKEKKLEGKP